MSFGGGVNSGAMVCGFIERGFRPHKILFADTGGELPATYDYIDTMSALTRQEWGVPIEVVKKTYQGKPETLEDNCLRKKMLPSLAYGRKACSMKFKVGPQEMALFHWMRDNGHHFITQAIGYDAGEGHRAIHLNETEFRVGRWSVHYYPLVEWGWDRSRCVEAIQKMGLQVPGKSSCFFCPAMKRHEILGLKENYPDYFKRALAIESNAHIISEGRGLGGSNRRWCDEDTKDEERKALLEWVDKHEPQKVPCGCYDG